jgi:hypothetical protein
MSAAGAFAEIAAWAEIILAGWRYLFSPTYRAQKHHDWHHEHVGYVIFDVFGGIVGVAFSVAVAFVAAALVWAWAFNEM